MYYIDIKDALYFIVICMVVLEILGKMACLINAWCCLADTNINSLRLRRRELIFRNLPSNTMR